MRGATLVETALVLALVGILTVVGLSWLPARSGLDAVQGELRGCLEQAQLAAQARGRELRVALQDASGALAPLVLPRGVRWGLPAGIPLPPRMAPPVRAHLTGQAHAQVTVTPRHTAQASAWFLTDGQDALYLSLSDDGRPALLRWRHRLARWTRV
jgi:type II secretory pathway pseudopilin PulG